METMEQQADIRWLQRYSNFHKAYPKAYRSDRKWQND